MSATKKDRVGLKKTMGWDWNTLKVDSMIRGFQGLEEGVGVEEEEQEEDEEEEEEEAE